MWISFGQSKDNQKIKTDPEVLERLANAERRLRSLDLEFSELWGKVRHALGRIDKRASIIEKQQPEFPVSGEPQGERQDVPDDPFDGLTPRQIQVNERILATRRRG